MDSYESPEYHPAFEEYCEAIYELHEDNVAVIQARVAERLAVSRAAVSEMIKRMETEGLVSITGSTISLTDRGMALAIIVVRRHRIAERFLTDILGLTWSDAHEEAGKWEHIISPVVEEAMERVLGDPTTCPHGNPIPGSGYVEHPDTVSLDSIPVGEAFVVRRITEELEFSDGILDFLEEASFMPGHTGIVRSIAPDGTTIVEIEGDPVGIGTFLGARIFVTPKAEHLNQTA